MNYTYLTQEKRYQIYALKKAGHKPSEIADMLDRDRSTISRELARNRGQRGYRPRQAQLMAEERRAINAQTIDNATWQFAQDKRLQQWSPEQISSYADISPETIYQRIYADKRAGDWYGSNCAARNSIKSATERMTGAALFPIDSSLSSVRPLSKQAAGLVTGKPTPSSAKTASKPLSVWLSVKPVSP